MSVEGIWQGLKVFEREDVDVSKFAIRSMRGIKRSTRSRGAVLGHRRGICGSDLLDYVTARRQIYLPTYRWMLEHHLVNELSLLAAQERICPIILLDYETNSNIDFVGKPLSHASLVARYLSSDWPGSDAAPGPSAE